MKIDTQGFESRVLDGAENSLALINTVEMEMALTPLYDGELLFHEMCQRMSNNGYTLVAIENEFSDPASGQLLEEISFPALNVSSCAFGGPHLTDLYVTTARKEMNAEQLAKYHLSGGLFRIRTDIQGLPTFAFGG